MAFKNLTYTEYVKLLLIHLAMGIAISMYGGFAKPILIGILIFLLFFVISRGNKNNEALMAAAYIAGAEVFFRQTGGVIFYETGKYSVILFLLIGMFFKGTSSRTTPFWIYLIILVPGVVIASQTLSYDVVFRKAVAFNLAGPVCLGISALYCYYKKISKIQFNYVLMFLLLPLVSHMIYLFLVTPNIGEALHSGTNSNYAASGGFGPNQISTVMGMGAFLLATRLFTIKNRIINLIDLVLFGMMSYRAIVTFSRGGVLTAIICIAAFLVLLIYKQDIYDRKKIWNKIMIFGGVVFGIWFLTTVLTQGLIVNRYTNRDAAGQLETDITTGRKELIVTELQGFYYNPVVGIGVGKGKEYRSEETGTETASHNEISRLLSEHGLLGLVAILILIFVPIIFWTKFKNNYYFLAFLAFWFLTINHSAMRIAMPAFVYGLALLYIVDDKKKSVYKKKVEAQ
ncbi:O-antigen ligase family protein [Salinimicrobium sediminilitoris]|uniref:O-antigen ligase family protein n=1 Tax=Salinimicrobium sediminilitoris TaxID=2876715 RepID=UPI001E557EBF|nr:O-antigen ligase family protein [Salinimicrobium sediminilitoris]MCC8358544.1 O-antigen ligase family protein [Salinimicrobium sediminilitoris]